MTPTRVSYGVLALTIVVAALFQLGPALLVLLFSYFALSQLYSVTKRKWIALALFLVLLFGIATAAVFFTRAAIRALPEMADTSIPSASAWAQKRQIELPFTDFDSLRAVIVDELKQEAHYLQSIAHFAGSTVSVLLMSIIAIVIACSLSLRSDFHDDSTPPGARNNLYFIYGAEISARFRDFYHSFATVMGAQITISLINTALTGIFLIAFQLPHAALLIATTFLCGLVPIVGNLVSNTIITFVALSVSLKLAVAALVFLVVVHKLEYFLNSKIIGQRIRNPVWLTLIALVIGERLMGIPGLVLAPVVLNYVRVEMMKVEVPAKP
jgi:predicted PurR-regulated permease PerM